MAWGAAVVTLLGGLVGCSSGDADGAGEKPREATWLVGPDRPKTMKGKAAWINGNAVVRVRSDGAAAYDLTNGRPLWTHTVPAPQIVCTVAEHADQGVGLIGQGLEDEPCDRVTAIDLATGRALWTRRLARTAIPGTNYYGVIEAGAGSALVPVAGRVRALDLRTAKARWTWTPPRGCAFTAEDSAMAAGPDAVVATFRCGRKAAKVAVADPARGRTRWVADLGVGAKFDAAEVLSVSPLVVRVKEDGERSRDELLTFDAKGTRLGAIPVSGPEGDLDLDLGDFTRRIAVGGDRIHVAAKPPGARLLEQDLLTFDLTGRRLWRSTFEDGVTSLALAAGGLTVLAQDPGDPALLIALDPATGKPVRKSWLRYDVNVSCRMFVAGGRHLMVNAGASTQSVPAIMAF
ncbi:PQQ-binding-like beta-propeller repeat protein [Actinomadura namibiensis]|uniref:Outer membrane protein assembly factor BamB n=1 Tax=Actinomadura namibiensis TaxID=182080 RepID=A0A7W3LS68_ACTNM|nr:PQQ-binding-like beta-propeller repeat protein [Actinomadura namibiensis]MBA8953220.1 outer membrane protein assembly factor BamB [Actinomadura namibiensis]